MLYFSAESSPWVQKEYRLIDFSHIAMIILALRYYSYRKHEKEVQIKAAEAATAQAAEDGSFDALKGEGSRPQSRGYASQ